MAKPGKKGIDYFSHDVDMMQDRRIKLLKAKHGIVGYAVYLRLLEELYREEGYFLRIDEDFNFLFADENSMDVNILSEIVNTLLSVKLFDNEIFSKYSILTSKRVQANYLEAISRRKEVTVIADYLVSESTILTESCPENVNIIKINANINTEKGDIQKQSKEKVKGQESKVQESTNADASSVDEIFFYWKNIMNKNGVTKLTPKRKKNILSRLKEGYTAKVIKQAIVGCSNSSFHMGKNDDGKTYNDIELICRSGEKVEYFLEVKQDKFGNNSSFKDCNKCFYGSFCEKKEDNKNGCASYSDK